MKKVLFFLLIFSGWFGWTSPVAAHIEQDTPPTCVLEYEDGSSVPNWQEMKGKVLYIDFWASWCPPCIKSFPFMNKLAQDFGEQGLEVIGINLDENRPDADAFLSRYQHEFSIVFNADKQCAKDFGVIAMPSSYIVDRRGIVRHIHRGFRPAESDALRDFIRTLVEDEGDDE